MKVFIVLAACFVACASASYQSQTNGLAASGSSSQFRSDDNNGNYNFGYDESHSTGGSSRREEETNGVRRGSYSLMDADGRRRTVNYVADASGFHATIESNEPGVEAKDPADVIINKSASAQGQYVASAPVYAPVQQQQQSYYQAPASAQQQTSYFQAPAAVQSYAAPAQTALNYAALAARVQSYSAAAPLAAAKSSTYNSHSYAAGSGAARYATSSYSAPVQSYGGSYATAAAVEAPTPRAFSYSFSSTHPAQVASYQTASAPALTSYSTPYTTTQAAALSTYAAPTQYNNNNYQQQQSRLY